MRSGGWKKSKKSINVEGGFFFKISKRDFTFIREMRVHTSLSKVSHSRLVQYWTNVIWVKFLFLGAKQYT